MRGGQMEKNKICWGVRKKIILFCPPPLVPPLTTPKNSAPSQTNTSPSRLKMIARLSPCIVVCQIRFNFRNLPISPHIPANYGVDLCGVQKINRALDTLQKASWMEWDHVQEQSILMVWPAGILQLCPINAEIFDKQIRRIQRVLNTLQNTSTPPQLS